MLYEQRYILYALPIKNNGGITNSYRKYALHGISIPVCIMNLMVVVMMCSILSSFQCRYPRRYCTLTATSYVRTNAGSAVSYRLFLKHACTRWSKSAVDIWWNTP